MLSTIEMCASSTGALIGMRATVVQVSEDGSILDTTQMNKIGSVTESGCTTLTLDTANGEYMTRIGIEYTSSMVSVVAL